MSDFNRIPTAYRPDASVLTPQAEAAPKDNTDETNPSTSSSPSTGAIAHMVWQDVSPLLPIVSDGTDIAMSLVAYNQRHRHEQAAVQGFSPVMGRALVDPQTKPGWAGAQAASQLLRGGVDTFTGYKFLADPYPVFSSTQADLVKIVAHEFLSPLDSHAISAGRLKSPYLQSDLKKPTHKALAGLFGVSAAFDMVRLPASQKLFLLSTPGTNSATDKQTAEYDQNPVEGYDSAQEFQDDNENVLGYSSELDGTGGTNQDSSATGRNGEQPVTATFGRLMAAQYSLLQSTQLNNSLALAESIDQMGLKRPLTIGLQLGAGAGTFLAARRMAQVNTYGGESLALSVSEQGRLAGTLGLGILESQLVDGANLQNLTRQNAALSYALFVPQTSLWTDNDKLIAKASNNLIFPGMAGAMSMQAGYGLGHGLGSDTPISEKVMIASKTAGATLALGINSARGENLQTFGLGLGGLALGTGLGMGIQALGKNKPTSKFYKAMSHTSVGFMNVPSDLSPTGVAPIPMVSYQRPLGGSSKGDK